MSVSPPKIYRKVLVAANGSSVDRAGGNFWNKIFASGVTVIGTNRALCFEVFAKNKPHIMVIRDTYRNLWSDQKFGQFYHEEYWKPFGGWKVGPAERRYTFCDEYVEQRSGWQERKRENQYGEALVMKNITVALMAANWAWINGAREIYFLGVDYFGRHGKMVEPFEPASVGWEGQYDKPVSQQVEEQFAQAARSVESGGGKMFNLSPGSQLRSLQKVDLERLFQ